MIEVTNQAESPPGFLPPSSRPLLHAHGNSFILVSNEEDAKARSHFATENEVPSTALLDV